MTSHVSRATLASLIVVGTAGCAIESPDVSMTQDTLLGGAVDTTHAFDVGICGAGTIAPGLPNAGACRGLRCSGTLIAPNVVLTARHCIRQIAFAPAFCDSTFSDAPLSPAAVLVTTSPTVASGSPVWYGVANELVPAGNNLCNDDIALLVLSAPVPQSEASPAGIDLNRDVAERAPRSVAIVGRGLLDSVVDVTTGAPQIRVTGGFLRRVLENIPFECATDDPASPCDVVDYSSPPTNMFASPPAYFVIGSSIASGDSGAGVFDQKHFSHRPRVIGVAAAATWNADGTNGHGLISRIDAHKRFIRAALHTFAPDCDDDADH